MSLRPLSILLLSMLVLIGACSGDDEPMSSTTDPVPTTEAPVEEEASSTTTTAPKVIEEASFPEELTGTIVDLSAAAAIIGEDHVLLAGVDGQGGRGVPATVALVPLDGSEPSSTTLPSDAPLVVVEDAASIDETIVVVGRIGVECNDSACFRERGAVWVSTDGGTSFVEVDGDTFSGQRQVEVTDVVPTDVGFVAVGQDVTDGTKIVTATWSSPDGQTWIRGADIDDPEWSVLPNALIAVDGGVVLKANRTTCGGVNPNGPGGAVSHSGIGNDGRVYASSDGLVWSQLAGPYDLPAYDCDTNFSNLPERTGRIYEIDGKALVVRGDGTAFEGDAAGLESAGTVSGITNSFDLFGLQVFDNELVSISPVFIEGDVPFIVVRRFEDEELIASADVILDESLDDPQLVLLDRSDDRVVLVLSQSVIDDDGVYQGSRTVVATGH